MSRRFLTVVAAVALGGAVAGTAVAMGVDPDPPHALTADEVYDDSMSLEQVAEAASGKVGELAPPCPPEDLVAKLKEADLEFGPCDPFPEDGKSVVVDGAPDPDEIDTKGVRCPAVVGSKGYPDLKVSLPCAAGAKIIDYVPVKVGTDVCMDLTYVASTDEKETTERLCPGDRASVGGTPVGAELPFADETH